MSGSRTTREARLALLCCAWVSFLPQTAAALDPNTTRGEYIVTRWGRESFPGSAVNAIAQTPDGRLWIGTENGLVRFDGINFRLIDHGNTPSLPPSPVLGLLVDSDGALWVRMQSPYLMRYRGERFEQMYPAKIPLEFTFAREEGAAAIGRGKLGEPLVAGPGAPLRYVAGKFTSIASSGDVHGIPTSIAETGDGVVWVGMRDAGLFCVRNGVGSQVGLQDQKVNILLPAGGARVWIGTDSGLRYWDGSAITRRGVPPAHMHTPILALARDRHSNLWISTSAGITRMGPDGAVIDGIGGPAPGTVRDIFEDREGNLWFGGTEGLMQLRSAPFTNYSDVASSGGSLYIDASGRTWIAPSSGGLLWLHGADRRSISALGVDHDVVYSITGGPGELWLGRRLGGVMQLREERGTVQARAYTAREGLAPGVVCAVHRARDGSIWAGTLGGQVSRIQNGRISTFTAADGLSADAVTTIQEAPDGAIWAGTAGGLQAFRNGKWERHGGENGVLPGRVNSITVDGEGVLWIGSYAGLLYWSGSRLESARNLPPSLQREIYGVAPDDLGNLWAVTDSQVVSIPRASLLGKSSPPTVTREFRLADGLPSTQGIRRDRTVVRDASGRIWLSLQGGLCMANPLLSAEAAAPLMNIESITADGRPLGVGPLIHYPSSRRRVTFNFIGVNLTHPGQVRYRYMLDGYDSDWSEPTEAREAAYTNLPPARYTFRVTASNGQGSWNGSSVSVPLEVEPQVSETWWFRAAMACVLAAGILVGLRYRLTRLHAAMSVRFEERLAERSRIARELHDTLLQSFQGLMLHLQVVDDLLPPGKAKAQLEQSIDRADQAIAEGRNAVYHLRSSTTNANDFAQAVRVLGDELASQHSVAFHLVVEGRARGLHPIIRDELFRFTQEALRNAFTHACAHHIETEITYGDRTLRLRVRDDGIGIPPDVLKSGRPGHYGLWGMRERAQQIGGKLEIWSGPKAGSEIELSIAGSFAYHTPTSRRFIRIFQKKVGAL